MSVCVQRELVEPTPAITPDAASRMASRRASQVIEMKQEESITAAAAAAEDPIVIVGMAGRVASAPDLKAFWTALAEGTEHDGVMEMWCCVTLCVCRLVYSCCVISHRHISDPPSHR